MGASYINYQVRADATGPVLAAARRICCGLAFVAPSRDGWAAVYDEESDSLHEPTIRQVAGDLSAALDTAVFAFWTYKGDDFQYWLYEGGRLVAEFGWSYDSGSRAPDPEAPPPPRPYPDQMVLFDVGPSRLDGLPGNPAAVLRHCRPGTPPRDLADLVRPDDRGDDDSPYLDADARLVGLARLLGIDEDRVRSRFGYLLGDLGSQGRAALPGVRKIRGRGPLRPPAPAGPVRSSADAVMAGDRAAVVRSLAEGGDPGALGDDGQSLLTLAAEWGHFAIALDLLAAGARPDEHDSATFLMRAVALGRPAAIPVLVAAGVDVAAHNHSALFGSVTAGSSDRPTPATIEALEALIRAGADVHARDEYGMTPLLRAAEEGHRAFLAPLLAAGADIEATAARGRTALHLAVRREARGWPRHLARALLAAGADPNRRDAEGATPLIVALTWAVRDDDAARLVSDLLRAGADPRAADGWWEGALVVALRQGHARTAALLRAAGAT